MDNLSDLVRKLEEEDRRRIEQIEQQTRRDAILEDHERLVEIACKDPEILDLMSPRERRKLQAIKRLRWIGQYAGHAPSLLAVKNAVEDYRVANAAEAPRRVYVVLDIQDRRLEVYMDEEDARARVTVINKAYGDGFAYYETHQPYAKGQSNTRI